MTKGQVYINCRDGWQVNEKIADRIVKAINRNDGECPCNNTSTDKHCPCSNYLYHDKCCCGLYIRK